MIPLRLLLGWPGPRWLFPAAGAVMAIASGLVNRQLLGAAYITWSALSTAWHESLWLPSAAAATMAAAWGAALFARGSVITAVPRPRLSWPLLLAHALGLALWLFVGHSIGLVPAAVAAATGATSGALDWQAGVVAAVGLGVVVTGAFALGVWLRRWILAPMAGVAAVLVLVLPEPPALRPFGLFLPVRHVFASPRFELSLPTTAFATVAAVVLCVWAARIAQAGVRGDRQAWAGVAAWSGALAVLVVTAFTWRPEFVVVDRPVPQTCRETDGVTVCLHQANEPAFGEVQAAVSQVRQAGLAPLVETVSDEAVVDRDRGEEEPGEVFVRLDPAPRDRRMAAQTIGEQVASELTDGTLLGRCVERDVPLSTYDTMGSVQRRVLELAGFTELAGHIAPLEGVSVAEMDAAELRDLIDRHASQIRECALTPAMLDR